MHGAGDHLGDDGYGYYGYGDLILDHFGDDDDDHLDGYDDDIRYMYVDLCEKTEQEKADA